MSFVTKDRLEALRQHSTLNGIDFVEVANAAQTQLNVHFLNANPLKGTVTRATITGGSSIPTVAVLPFGDADWSVVNGHPLLTLHTAAPGDFSNYTLTLESANLDRHFDHAVFSFKAGCPSDLDCAVPCPPCPPLPADFPPIDYLAKDFLSFRRALSDFSALRYPEWQERSEADFGMMFLEALCGLADDLSYVQDRIAAEAYLDTATQRRSIVRHARLVDYEPRPATAARTLLQFDVSGSPLPTGLVVSAQDAQGEIIPFEIGTGLHDPASNYAVSPRWNRGILPYFWDDSQECLPAGSTEMWVIGWGFGFTAEQWLLLDTRAAFDADPPRRSLVQLTAAEETTDPLFVDPATGNPYEITRIVWRAEDALRFDHDLTRTVLAGNLIPATQGRRCEEWFAIGQPPPTVPQMPLAIAREGASHAATQTAQAYLDGQGVGGCDCDETPLSAPETVFLHTLARAPLVWLPQDDPNAPPLPEIRLIEDTANGQSLWNYRRSLLQSEAFKAEFTLDPVRYARIAPRRTDRTVFWEYDGDAGETIRFGDGIFGGVPETGATFKASYRMGGGALGNVAADSIRRVDPQTAPNAAARILAVTNPFPAEGGEDAESNEQVRRLAPQAFRARQFRAVRREDYEAAAQTLPWVSRAGASFRWTGSWLTVFTVADPKGSQTIPVARHTQLIDLLNRYRMAGYESYAPAPRYLSLDLEITVCARPTAFQSEVKAAILSTLSASVATKGSPGFFHPDSWTFGTPLERSALEAVIQQVPGVGGVVSIRVRRRSGSGKWMTLPQTLRVGVSQIVRADNDPSQPENGSMRVIVEGGK